MCESERERAPCSLRGWHRDGEQNEEILSTFAREVFFGLSCKNLLRQGSGAGRARQPLYTVLQVETIKVILSFVHISSIRSLLLRLLHEIVHSSSQLLLLIVISRGFLIAGISRTDSALILMSDRRSNKPYYSQTQLKIVRRDSRYIILDSANALPHSCADN